MAEAKTKRSDVVATFHRYIGRNPISSDDWATINFLMSKPPQEVEARLAKNAEEIKSRNADARKNATTSNIDPIKVAQKLGYTTSDFANDPGFVKYWENKSQAELEEALKNRGDYDQTAGRKRTPSEQSAFNENQDWLNGLLTSGEIDQAQFDALTGIINTDDYTSGQRIYSDAELQKIARDAEAKARTDLEPYYADVERREMEDLKAGYADIRNEALRYQQQEAKSYEETLAKTKQNLRARGLTFSGRSRGILGKESALEDKGVEGELLQQRRYNWEDARAAWQERARDIGTAAERKYGSSKLYEQRDFLNPEGLPDPYEGTKYVTGRVAPIYSPKKDATQRGYVSRDQADIEKQKELEVQTRAEDRKRTYRRY
jgi:hypothetical protein